MFDHSLLQFIRTRKVFGPQESKMRLAALAAFAYRHDIPLGPVFTAIAQSLSYRTNGEIVIGEPPAGEQRQPQSVAPVVEEKPLTPARTGGVLEELDEQEKK
jgi:hypothetical protein